MGMKRFNVTSKYAQVHMALLMENMKKNEDFRKTLNQFIKKMKDIPHETMREMEKIEYPMEHYVNGAVFDYEVKQANTKKISQREISAGDLLCKYLETKAVCDVKICMDSNSCYHYFTDEITVGCHVAPLKAILRRSCIEQIVFITYLHELGHKKDRKRLDEIFELDDIIEVYGRKFVGYDKDGDEVYKVVVPDHIFKIICIQHVESEFRAWEYVRRVSKDYRLSRKDIEIYRQWALFSYINGHHKNMKKRTIKIANYIFKSEGKE